MTTNDPRNEDGGYGAGNLVGSSESGVRSAIEARRAVEAARDGGAAERDDVAPATASGSLARTDTPGGPRAGMPPVDDALQGTSAPPASRDARGDAARLED